MKKIVAIGLSIGILLATAVPVLAEYGNIGGIGFVLQTPSTYSLTYEVTP